MRCPQPSDEPQTIGQILKPLTEKLERQARRSPSRHKVLAEEISRLTRQLRHEQKTNQQYHTNAWRAIQELWLTYDITTRRNRWWESRNVRKAAYLYAIKYAEISREAKVAYRTVQYFAHDPDRVGMYSCRRIVMATKLCLARQILHFEEPYQVTWNRWNAQDAKPMPSNFFRTLKDPIGDSLRELERKPSARPLTNRPVGNS